jgi:hypothetical protein
MARTLDASTRALSLARQSRAALDAVAAEDPDVSVLELRQAVNDWISTRERPVGKPRGNLVGINRVDLKISPNADRGATGSGF